MKEVRNLIVLCFSEMLGNVTRLWDVLKNFDYRTAVTLITVKMMDYSDHIPLGCSPKPLIISGGRELIEQCLFKLKASCAQNIDWRFKSQELLEISYNASLGDPEMHPHVTHTFTCTRNNQRSLIIRYFDDESTVWQGNPLRASTTTLAELVVDIDSNKLQLVRYYRYRTAKRSKFNRRQTFAKLHKRLDSFRPHCGLKFRRITFGFEASEDAFQVICRYALDPRKSRLFSLLTATLVSAQLRIVNAILRENVLFTQMALNCFKERATKGVHRMGWGKKQLRVRVLTCP